MKPHMQHGEKGGNCALILFGMAYDDDDDRLLCVIRFYEAF